MTFLSHVRHGQNISTAFSNRLKAAGGIALLFGAMVCLKANPTGTNQFNNLGEHRTPFQQSQKPALLILNKTPVCGLAMALK